MFKANFYMTNDIGSQIFQYFLEVVPTVVQTSYANVETYQYAVTERVWITNLWLELLK